MLISVHEGIYLGISAFHLSTAVDSAVSVKSKMTVVLKNVENGGHLREDQDLMPSFFMQFG